MDTDRKGLTLAAEVDARMAAVRAAKDKARGQGRKTPTMGELTEVLGDELGVSVETRRRERIRTTESTEHTEEERKEGTRTGQGRD